MSSPIFLTSAASRADFPDDIGREVAFVGRSNSGKSTALNSIVGVRKLARVSKSPGRTQLINFFELAPQRRLVDLPGYGFARVPAGVKARWRGLVEAYFGGRASLTGVVLTVDIRRGLTALDEQMLDWIGPLELPLAVLLTKADKLGHGAAHARAREVGARLGPDATLMRFSALESTGVVEARAWLEARWAMGARDLP